MLVNSFFMFKYKFWHYHTHCNFKSLSVVGLPDEVQWLVFVPHAPPGPAFVQQVPMVLCSVCSDGVFAVVAPLLKSQNIMYTHIHETQCRNCMHCCNITENSDDLKTGNVINEFMEIAKHYLVKRESGLI